MKFECNPKTSGEIVGYLFTMADGGPETTSLAIRRDDGKVAVLYYDGSGGERIDFLGDLDQDLIQALYKGDSVTITL